MRRLAVAAAAIAAIMATSLPATASTTSDAVSTIVFLTNDLRDEEGLKALSEDTKIDAVAQAYSESQLPAVVAAWKKYLAGGSLSVPLKHNPSFSSQMPSGWTKAAENVAWACGYSSASKAAQVLSASWENSSGHRANMLGDFNRIGVGFAWDAATGCAYGTQNFGKYATTTTTTSSLEFTDVTPSSPGYEAITWVGEEGIATGFSDGSFRPLRSTARRQMAYFMYRYAGEPDFTMPAKSPFSDVQPGDPGYEAIMWLYVEGIATGYSDGTFRPTEPVARRQMAYFMYRFAGEPAFTAPSKSPFSDVQPGDPGYKAIMWVYQQEVATGFADGTYRPVDNVARRQMAYFMYRYVNGG